MSDSLAKQRCLKGALFLSRVLLASTTNTQLDLTANQIELDDEGFVIRYEGVILSVADLAGGAMMLLRGLAADVAQLQEVEPADVARTLELYTSATEATFGFHPEEWPDDEEDVEAGSPGGLPSPD